MGKERLMAFTDAVLAIVMTILVLELEKPAAATFEALLNLKESFFAYALSFFWLGTMWVNLHREWHGINQISNAVVWWSIVLLFFSSLIPYAIRFANMDYSSGVTQGFYGIMVLLVTLAYCTHGCPQNIAIPQHFALLNSAARTTGSFSSQNVYYNNTALTHGKASECVGCKQCEKARPQHLPITEHLKAVAAKFEQGSGFPTRR